MTEKKKEELRQLLIEATAKEYLKIRPRSESTSQLPSIDVQGYRRLLQQRWKSYSEDSLWILRSFDPHIASEPTKSKLLDFLRKELDPFIHEDKILSASHFLIGGFSEGFPLDRLLDQLLKIAIARGVEEAVSAFDRCTKETHGPVQYLTLLEGIKLETEIQMFEGIRLVPLPSSASELPYHLSNAFRHVPEDFFSEKTLLVVDCSVSPIFHKPFQAATIQEYEDQENSIFRVEINSEDFPNLKIDDFPLNLLCQALSLACHSEVKISFITKFLAEDVLYNLSFGMGGSSWHSRPLGNVTEAGQSQIDEAKRFYEILVNIDSDTREKLQIAIDRWVKSTASRNQVDKMIDLGIALESLYLPKSNIDQLAFQLRLRASWHLGKNKEDRKKLIDEFKAIYTLRSKAVHNGVIPQRVKIREGESVPTSEFIPKAQDLCRRSIMKILEDGEFPDWDNLILG